jgi:ankyrin repeat protein
MGLASSEIVVALLDAGANINATDIMGNDAVMLACSFNRLDNIKTWFSRPGMKWNINRENEKFGSTALHFALYMGPQKLKIVRYLIEKLNAGIEHINKSGTSSLILACSNEDADPKVVQYLLERCNLNINRQITSRTVKWKMLRTIARFVVRFKLTQSKLYRRVAESGGLTALHYAARRGDVEIVELLMAHNAQPFIKNNLGRDVFSYCDSFPEIKGAIKRIQRQENCTYESSPQMSSSVGTTTTTTRSTTTTRKSRINSSLHASTSTTKSFTLQRRLSTATPVKYDMYLMNISKMISLFGDIDDRTRHLNLCHQDLLKKGKLTRFEDLPMGAFVMFVSHQWNGFRHPDPKGVHIHCMVNVLRRLRDGKIDRVDTDPFHTILYNTNRVTRKKEWMELLSNAYVFYDFWSQPQPCMEPKNSPHRARLEQDLTLAIHSMGAYVERADCLVVLVPGSAHVDRMNTRMLFVCLSLFLHLSLCSVHPTSPPPLPHTHTHTQVREDPRLHAIVHIVEEHSVSWK